MLVNLIYDPDRPLIPPERRDDPIYSDFSDHFKQLVTKDILRKLADGIYQYWDIGHIMLPGYKITHYIKVPHPFIKGAIMDRSLPHGVCDNYQQILERDSDIQPYIDDPDKKYIIQLCYISKKSQPSEQGWRWEKWGDYIGDQNSYTEYLYDEPEIEGICTYMLCEVTETK